MQHSTENKKQTPVCKSNQALVNLLSGYSKEDIDAAFYDMRKVFLQWLSTNYADDTANREEKAFSMEIIEEVGTVIKGIPKKKIRALKKEMQKQTA